MSAKPTRLRLSRKKGFDLQKHSMRWNGLSAVKVARPGRWGNPFVVTEKMSPGSIVGGAWGYRAVPTVEDAVECFRLMVPQCEGMLAAVVHELRGHNLACWCALDQPCHADVLLDLANRPACDDPASHPHTVTRQGEKP